MKFTLIYDGPLESAGNKPKRTEQWIIRKQFDPQIRQLWELNRELIDLKNNPRVSRDGQYIMTKPHHSVAETAALSTAVKTGPLASGTIPLYSVPVDEIDLCAEMIRGGKRFFPLVSEALGLRCSLTVQFLRREAPGNVYQGGDLDGRIKLLLDALSVPQEGQVCDDPDCPEPLYCLLEDDKLVTGLDVQAERLLTPSETKHDVRLIIGVEVRVAVARPYNFAFLAD